MSFFRCLCRTRVSVQARGFPCEQFRNKIRLYDKELLASRPNPKLEDHSLSAVRDRLFNIFAATLHIGGRSSIRSLRTRHAVLTGTHLSWHTPLELKIFWGTVVPSGNTDRYSRNMFEGTERSRKAPQTARIATSLGAQACPSSSHTPLELQHVRGNREVPTRPPNNLCITDKHCNLFSVQCEYPASSSGCMMSNGIWWGEDVEGSSRRSISPLWHEVCETAGLCCFTMVLFSMSTKQFKDGAFFWRVTPCTLTNACYSCRENWCCQHFFLEDSDSRVVRNAGNYLPDYTASHPRKKALLTKT